MNYIDNAIKPPAKARASQAKGKCGGTHPANSSNQSVGPYLSSFQKYDKPEELLLPQATKKSTGKKKSPSRGSPTGGETGKHITFHLGATCHGAFSSAGEKSSGKPSASDVKLNASPKRPKRRQRKKRTQEASVHPIVAVSSPTPKASIPAAPITTEMMEIGEDDESSTTSVASTRTYASVTSNKFPPNAGNGETESPSPVTDCAESSNYQAQIADLKREMAESKAHPLLRLHHVNREVASWLV
jgi:hypothetical protein